MIKESFKSFAITLAFEKIKLFNSLAFTKEELSSHQYAEHYTRMIQEEAIDERFDAGSPEELLDSLVDSIVVAIQYPPLISGEVALSANRILAQAIYLGEINNFNLTGALHAVCDNNLTKFPSIQELKDWYGDLWMIPSCDWIESQGRYKDVTTTMVDDNGTPRVVFKDGTGKVVKWAGYEEVDLEEFL